MNVERKVPGAKLWALKAETRQAKAERKKLKGMVRRKCKQCGHEWVIPKKPLEAAEVAATLGSPTDAIAEAASRRIWIRACRHRTG